MQNRAPRGPRPIQDVIRTFLRERGLGARALDQRVFRAWKDAVGEALARRAVPVRFQRGELTVEVDSSAYLQELRTFTGEGYRRRANGVLESEAIRSVAFKLRT